MQEWLDSAPDKVKQALASLPKQNKVDIDSFMQQVKSHTKKAP